ncbi:arginase family protein [Salinibacterium sp. SWN1162]|uniref:arginase family protein n=1 Tax=Salinibacterium sp. SWN1162 TaxID=2792053 RepID=UPI0018CF0DC8|nr:arginase family protein [Salinibacterium sp. SWN1162]MBH0010273.1 arginase family protein [Salinibacterium sp. SWN1162]
MTINYVVVPQWQGSGSSRAMQLVDGAESIRGDLPSALTRTVDIPLEAGDHQGTGVHRYSSLLLVRDRLRHALAEGTEAGVDTHVTIGGDCGVELAAIEHVSASEPAVVWLDAHPDLHTAATSPSGAFTGMVLRTLLGDGPSELVPAHPVRADRVILAGVRSVDIAEDDYIAQSGIRMLGPVDFSAETLLEAIAATGADSVYLHVDLDVLDPADFAGLGSPVPFGIEAGVLIDAIRAVVAKYPLAGAGITEFAPASMAAAVDDSPTILRLIGALASAGSHSRGSSATATDTE